MRIIGGTLKGKTIMPPAGYAARPTTDFAKEGLFNILNNQIDFEEVVLLDLFSGTGSISVEFASRGAREIVSVEMNPANARFISQTARVLGIKNIHVVKHNVFDFLEICSKKFNIIFADPPYQLEGLDTIPNKVLDANILDDGGFFILEHSAANSFEMHPQFVKERKYGNVHFSFFTKQAAK